MLDNYLALAFQHADVDLLRPLRSENTDFDVPGHRTALLVRAIEAHPGPCVLALDELERLRDPRSVALLDWFLRSNPDGLHVALGCRELPAGLDVGTMVFSGQAAMLTTEDLRFSSAKIAQFFDDRPSGRELAKVVKQSAGWPIALRIRDNGGDRAATGAACVMRRGRCPCLRMWGRCARRNRRGGTRGCRTTAARVSSWAARAGGKWRRWHARGCTCWSLPATLPPDGRLRARWWGSQRSAGCGER